MFFSCREVPKVDTSPCPYHMVIDIIIKKFLEKGPFIDENQHSTERLWNLLQSVAAGSHSAFSKAAGVGVIAILREHHQIKVRNGEIINVLRVRKRKPIFIYLDPITCPSPCWEQKESGPKELKIIKLETQNYTSIH